MAEMQKATCKALGFTCGMFVVNVVFFLSNIDSQRRPCVLEFVSVTSRSEPGWKTVSFHVGDLDVLAPGPQFHSQVGQDQTIAMLFKELPGPRFFVDLAANDAQSLSNTLALERDFGWDGLLIEANPQYYWRLAHRRAHVVAAAIGSPTNTVVEFALKGLFGGIIDKEFDNHEAKKEDRQQYSTVSIGDVLERYNAPTTIDYFSLDVEGAESMVMLSFPFDRYRILTLTVERPKADLEALLESSGMIYVGDHGRFGDRLYIHQSFPNLAEVLPSLKQRMAALKEQKAHHPRTNS